MTDNIAGENHGSGNPEVFVRLFLTTQRRFYGLILSLVVNRNDAEDLLQETSAVMWRKFDDFAPVNDMPLPDAFAAWGLKIARFEALKFLERERTLRRHFSAESLEKLANEAAVMVGDSDQFQEALKECMTSLAEADRKVVALRYGEGGSAQLISKTLGRSIFTIYKMLNRIHRQLLKCIQSKTAGEAT